MWLAKKISQMLLALPLLRQQLRRELNILTVCAYLFFWAIFKVSFGIRMATTAAAPTAAAWGQQVVLLLPPSASFSTMGSHQDIWVSGLISGQCYGSVLSGNFQCKNKSRWHGSRWHGNSSGSSIKAKRREGWGGKSLFELVSNCRQLVIPLELSAFKFILLSHLQVIPRREMNIISMSVYFVFGTRRTHKNKRQISPPHANDTPLTNHLSQLSLFRMSHLAQLEWKINENFLCQVMKCDNFSHGVKNTQLIEQLSSWYSSDWGNNNFMS